MKNKGLLLTGCLLYLVLSCLALHYYQERNLYSDCAGYIFHFIIYKHFWMGDRIIDIFIQGPTLFLIYMHVPLKAVLIINSLSFVFYHFAVFLICLLGFRNTGFALAMTLFSVFIVHHTFFWIVSELPLGIGLSMILFSYMAQLDKDKLNKVGPLLILLTLLTFVVFAHPLMLFVFGLSCIYFLINDKIIDRKVILIAMAAFGLIWTFKRFGLPVEATDANGMDKARNVLKLFPHYFDLYSNRHFIQACLQYYYAIPLAFLTVVITLIVRKAWRVLLFFIIAIPGYLLFINISFFDCKADYYIENLYLSFSIVLIIPLVFEVLLPIVDKKWFIPLLLIFFALRVVDIVDGSTWYRNRLAWNKHLLQETANWPNRKLVLDAAKTPKDTLESTWASGYELLELSSLAGPDSARCITIDEHPNENLWRYRSNHTVITRFEAVDYKDLDHKYFNPTDTSNYVLVDHL